MEPLVIVTGASGGIGAAITEELLRRGCRVVGACRHPERLPRHERLEGLNLDLGSRASVARAAEALGGRTLHAIINNAGIMPLRLTRITADGLEQTYQVNFEGTRQFTRLLLPQMARGGVVVFTSSVTRRLPRAIDRPAERAAACRTPLQRFMNYARTKRLVADMAARMADELQPQGIRVNVADPGVVSTGIIRLGYKAVDWLADIFFRPFISTPQQGARSALRAYDSELTGVLYTQKGRASKLHVS